MRTASVWAMTCDLAVTDRDGRGPPPTCRPPIWTSATCSSRTPPHTCAGARPLRPGWVQGACSNRTGCSDFFRLYNSPCDRCYPRASESSEKNYLKDAQWQMMLMTPLLVSALQQQAQQIQSCFEHELGREYGRGLILMVLQDKDYPPQCLLTVPNLHHFGDASGYGVNVGQIRVWSRGPNAAVDKTNSAGPPRQQPVP